VNKNCDLKICDFGLARVLSTDEEDTLGRTDYVVTRWYRAPEVVLLASEYTKSIDVWAVGCILCELVQRKPIFAGKDHLDQIKKIIGVIGTPSEEELHWLPQNGSARAFLKKCPPAPKASWDRVLTTASPVTRELVEATLHFDPTIRISVNEALRLKYFENLFEEEDMVHDTRVGPMDWSFDNFEPTKPLLQNYVYLECVAFHPEIADRDRPQLQLRGQPFMDKLAKVLNSESNGGYGGQKK